MRAIGFYKDRRGRTRPISARTRHSRARMTKASKLQIDKLRRREELEVFPYQGIKDELSGVEKDKIKKAGLSTYDFFVIRPGKDRNTDEIYGFRGEVDFGELPDKRTRLHRIR